LDQDRQQSCKELKVRAGFVAEVKKGFQTMTTLSIVMVKKEDKDEKIIHQN
jgi:hypothetical protein